MNGTKDWQKWGEIDPLWSVATWPGKQAGGAAPWTDAEFYATGQEDWARYLALWERYGLDRAACVEIGCGAGRLTMHLGKTFGHTFGLDVAQGMLVYARAHVANPAVEFVHVEGTSIPLPDASATAVFSTFVFQHFDSLQTATGYFREIARVLRPGGSMLIQLPIHHWPWDREAFGLLHRAYAALTGTVVWLRRGLGPLGVQPPMRALSYPQGYLFTTLHQAGLAEIEICSIPGAPGSRAPHQMLFARKP